MLSCFHNHLVKLCNHWVMVAGWAAAQTPLGPKPHALAVGNLGSSQNCLQQRTTPLPKLTPHRASPCQGKPESNVGGL